MDFGKENGGMLAPKINEKTISTSKSDFVGFVRFPWARIIFFIILEVEVGRKIGLKSMKIPSQDGRASWHRFLNDFD